jgi:hypothetical protein
MAMKTILPWVNRHRTCRPATESDLYSGADLYVRDAVSGKWVQVEYRP